MLRAGRLQHPLVLPVTVAGRLPRHAANGYQDAPDIDLGPIDPRKVVSRRHAHLICDGRAVYLRDMGSTNGTLVNGELLLRGSVLLLRNGDSISLGGVVVRFDERGRWPAGLVPRWREHPGPADPDPPPDMTLPGPR